MKKPKLRVKYHLHTTQKDVPTTSSNLARLEKYAKPGDYITTSLVLVNK